MPLSVGHESVSDQFTRREFALVAACQAQVGRLRRTAAQLHLREGFERRVLLNQTSRRHLEDVAAPERKQVLNPHACSELNVHLNSFYIQLRGALDNLAWVLQYEFAVLGVGDETTGHTRSRCSLFDSRFNDALNATHHELAASLRQRRAWFDTFKDLRDPVAHRVPLYAMPGVIRQGSPDESRQNQIRLDIAKAIEAGDLAELSGKVLESFDVGTYEPWFTQYGPSGYAVRDIRGQIHNDQAEFLAIGETVLRALFSAPSPPGT